MTDLNSLRPADVGTIRAHLYQLGWAWRNKRVQTYLKACAARLNHLEYQKLEDVPPFVLNRLAQFLKIYQDCNQILNLLQSTWDDTVVTDVAKKFSDDGRMTFQGYQHLYEVLETYWFVHGGGF